VFEYNHLIRNKIGIIRVTFFFIVSLISSLTPILVTKVLLILTTFLLVLSFLTKKNFIKAYLLINNEAIKYRVLIAYFGLTVTIKVIFGYFGYFNAPGYY
jgi:hypothetical protein